MSKLNGKLFHYGSVSISTNANGNGTASVTFPTSFSKRPHVTVYGSQMDVKGKYGVKNSPELILAKGRQPMNSITAFADGGSGYVTVTGETFASGASLTSFADNKDGKTLVTLAGHGLTEGTVIQIYNDVAASGMNGFFAIEQVATDTFVIDREFLATGTPNFNVNAHDLQDDDIIEIINSTQYAGIHTVSSSSTTFKIDITGTYVAEASPKAYWKLLPSCEVDDMTVEVVNSDVRGGTVTAIWLAIEK